MPGPLRDRSGAPNLRARVLAALVLLGLLFLTVPTVVVPVLRTLSGLVF